MKHKLFFRIIAAAALLFMAAGCSNLVEKNAAKPSETKKVQLVLSATPCGARTIIPANIALDKMSYTLTGKKTGGSFKKTWKTYSAMTSDENVFVDAGTWEFTLDALKDEVIVYTAKKVNVELEEGVPKPLAFEFLEAEGKGAFSVKVNLPAQSKIKTVRARLYDSSFNPIEGYDFEELEIVANSATFEKTSVPNGLYRIGIQFLGEDNKEVCSSYDEVALIKAGRTCTTELTIQSDELNIPNFVDLYFPWQHDMEETELVEVNETSEGIYLTVNIPKDFGELAEYNALYAFIDYAGEVYDESLDDGNGDIKKTVDILYPFVEDGKEYTVIIELRKQFRDEDGFCRIDVPETYFWQKLKVTAHGGLGEVTMTKRPEFILEKNGDYKILGTEFSRELNFPSVTDVRVGLQGYDGENWNYGSDRTMGHKWLYEKSIYPEDYGKTFTIFEFPAMVRFVHANPRCIYTDTNGKEWSLKWPGLAEDVEYCSADEYARKDKTPFRYKEFPTTPHAWIFEDDLYKPIFYFVDSSNERVLRAGDAYTFEFSAKSSEAINSVKAQLFDGMWTELSKPVTTAVSTAADGTISFTFTSVLGRNVCERMDWITGEYDWKDAFYLKLNFGNVDVDLTDIVCKITSDNITVQEVEDIELKTVKNLMNQISKDSFVFASEDQAANAKTEGTINNPFVVTKDVDVIVPDSVTIEGETYSVRPNSISVSPVLFDTVREVEVYVIKDGSSYWDWPTKTYYFSIAKTSQTQFNDKKITINGSTLTVKNDTAELSGNIRQGDRYYYFYFEPTSLKVDDTSVVLPYQLKDELEFYYDIYDSGNDYYMSTSYLSDGTKSWSENATFKSFWDDDYTFKVWGKDAILTRQAYDDTTGNYVTETFEGTLSGNTFTSGTKSWSFIYNDDKGSTTLKDNDTGTSVRLYSSGLSLEGILERYLEFNPTN